MSFVSAAFAILFLIVFTARLTIGRRKTEPSFLFVLLVASLVFYGWHVPAYLLILLGSAGIDYVAALWLGPREDGAQSRRRKLLLAASMTANLGLLAFFKYSGFALEVWSDAARAIGHASQHPSLGLILPMGISFYTFQSMSYTIDVYRGVLAPVRSFPRFILFISFFPQLVAGPIVRATEFLPQMARTRRLRLRVFYEGAWLMLVGYFLKTVCADNLALQVDRYWALGTSGTAGPVAAGSLALMFSGQIFADFAGYSSIAIGLGYLLGYRFPENFNAPYIAGTFSNFWTRWHITLSRWLRDYLYIPLGGNRGTRARTYVNLMLVMLLGGLWHGAAYHFIIWGALHGGALAIERALGINHYVRHSRALRLAWLMVVQLVVLIAWVFFRSPSVGDGVRFLGSMLTSADASAPWVARGLLFLLPIVALHVWRALEERGRVAPLGARGRIIFAGAMLAAIATLSAPSSAFIYFQF